MSRLECEDEECVRKKLASNKQFAELLEELGVTVPLKNKSRQQEKKLMPLQKATRAFSNCVNTKIHLFKNFVGFG
jgi:hypothetical protein